MTVRVKSSMVVTQGGAGVSRDVLESFADHVVTVTQKEHESLAQLAQRVRRAVVYLQHHQVQLESALFVAHSGFDLPDVPATSDLIRHMVTHMVAAGTGELHLRTADSDPRARYALMALADALRDQVRGTGVQVVTRQPDPSQKILVSEVSRIARVGKRAASA